MDRLSGWLPRFMSQETSGDFGIDDPADIHGRCWAMLWLGLYVEVTFGRDRARSKQADK